MTLRGLPQQSVCRHAAGKHQEIRDFSRNPGGTSPTVAVMAAPCATNLSQAPAAPDNSGAAARMDAEPAAVYVEAYAV
jgi:hypothetical protein